MIEINPTLALSLYLGLFLLTMLTLWFLHLRKREKKLSFPPLFQLYTCEYCHFPYLDQTHKAVTKCPQCHSYNKKR